MTVAYQNSLSVTAEAANWISSQLKKHTTALGIRVGVKESGCTGYKYVLAFENQPADTDHIIEEHGVKVFVDSRSMEILAGTILDYKVDGLNSGLDFVNPNVTAQCGCGESFTV